MIKERVFPIIAILITVIIWGISFVNIKIASITFQPMSLGFIRFSLASLILFIIIKLLKIKIVFHKEDLGTFLLVSGIGITLYYYFETVGIKLTSPSEASLIISSIPIFSLISEKIVFKEKFYFSEIIAAIISIIGVIIIVELDFKSLFIFSKIKGTLMMLGAASSWIIYSIITKKLYNKYDKLNIVYIQMIFGAIFFLPFALFEKNNFSTLNSTILIHLVILTIFASLIAYYLYNFALEKLSVTESSLYLNLIPVVTIVFSYFYLSETIKLRIIIGAILIIGAVIFSVKRDKVKS